MFENYVLDTKLYSIIISSLLLCEMIILQSLHHLVVVLQLMLSHAV